ncbi:MAG: Xaa-Pro peptidase family protein [Deltaproteobacteria bacterium]|nr:Xaa-Pro peptidase family protein [Deltaproteobacteria bacterium]
MLDPRPPAEEIHRRRHAVQEGLLQRGIDGLLVTHPPDLLYLSGTSRGGYLFLPCQGDPIRVDEGPDRGLERIAGRIRDALGRLPAVLGLEMDVLPVRHYMAIRRVFPGSGLRDGSPVLLGSRMLKSAWEIGWMEHVAERTAQVFASAGDAMEPGLTEIAFSGRLEALAGALGISGRVRVRDYRTEGYPWHVLAGKSGGMVGVLDAPATGEGTSPAFPCGAGYRPLATGEPVMVDFAVRMGGYHMDETRMLAMGPLSREAGDACRAAVEIHDRVLEQVEPGRSGDELFRCSRDAARELGYEGAYLGPPEGKVRFLGHGIGVELIEPPLIALGRKEPLAPGMTFALEPKMVFEGRFAAGVESVVTVTETGHRLISRVPVEVLYS